MESYSVHFRFSQHFDFPPKDAFRWCVDYDPKDIERMGDSGRRIVKRLTDDTFLLTDTYPATKGRVSKVKMVRIYPETLSWTNTRMSLSGRYSQFLYHIAEEPGGSRLDFTGSQIFEGKKPGPSKMAALANELAAEDSRSWRNLAKAMATDLSRG